MTNRIAELRRAQCISQAELADAVDVTRQTIISLESGRYNASLLLAHKIARYFELTIEEVFLFEESCKQKSSPKTKKFLGGEKGYNKSGLQK